MEGISGVDLTEDRYTVAESLLRNRYRISDGEEKLVLRADKPETGVTTGVPFLDGDGNEVFTVRTGNVDDDYFVIPAESEYPTVILEQQSTPLHPKWNVRNGHNERLLVTIEATGTAVQFFRYYVPMMGVLPHTYRIEAADGTEVGTLSGKTSLTDKYELDITEADEMLREPLVLAAVAIDVLDED